MCVGLFWGINSNNNRIDLINIGRKKRKCIINYNLIIILLLIIFADLNN